MHEREKDSQSSLLTEVFDMESPQKTPFEKSSFGSSQEIESSDSEEI